VTPRFAIELRPDLDTSCLKCRARFRVDLAAWAMRIDDETIGHLCERCITPTALELLMAERGRTAQ
jgi:hypothetical protein